VAVSHNGLGWFETAFDHRIQARRPLDFYCSVFDGVIVLDDVCVLAQLADLDGRGRDDDRRRVLRQCDVDVDELSRPEPAIAIEVD